MEKNADVNIVDKYGNGPLWYAINPFNMKNAELVKLISDKKPDLHKKNKFGMTLIEAIKEENDEYLTSLFIGK